MNIGEAIPQFFYDLIARVIPGLVFIFCFCFAFDQLYYLRQMMGLSILVLFVFAYVVDALVHCLSLIFNYCWFKKDTEDHLIQELTDGYKSFPSPKKFQEIIRNEMVREFSGQEGKTGFQELIDEERLTAIIFIWFDRIRMINPSQGFRIAKMRAEYHSSASLFFILSIFGPIIIFTKLTHSGVSGIHWFIFIFLSIFGSFYVNKRLRHLHSITILRTLHFRQQKE